MGGMWVFIVPTPMSKLALAGKMMLCSIDLTSEF